MYSVVKTTKNTRRTHHFEAIPDGHYSSNMCSPFFDDLLFVGGQVHADPTQHVGELLPSQHPVAVIVYLSETPPETLDLVSFRLKKKSVHEYRNFGHVRLHLAWG